MSRRPSITQYPIEAAGFAEYAAKVTHPYQSDLNLTVDNAEELREVRWAIVHAGNSCMDMSSPYAPRRFPGQVFMTSTKGFGTTPTTHTYGSFACRVNSTDHVRASDSGATPLTLRDMLVRVMTSFYDATNYIMMVDNSGELQVSTELIDVKNVRGVANYRTTVGKKILRVNVERMLSKVGDMVNRNPVERPFMKFVRPVEDYMDVYDVRVKNFLNEEIDTQSATFASKNNVDAAFLCGTLYAAGGTRYNFRGTTYYDVGVDAAMPQTPLAFTPNVRAGATATGAGGTTGLATPQGNVAEGGPSGSGAAPRVDNRAPERRLPNLPKGKDVEAFTGFKKMGKNFNFRTWFENLYAYASSFSPDAEGRYTAGYNLYMRTFFVDEGKNIVDTFESQCSASGVVPQITNFKDHCAQFFPAMDPSGSYTDRLKKNKLTSLDQQSFNAWLQEYQLCVSQLGAALNDSLRKSAIRDSLSNQIFQLCISHQRWPMNDYSLDPEFTADMFIMILKQYAQKGQQGYGAVPMQATADGRGKRKRGQGGGPKMNAMNNNGGSSQNSKPYSKEERAKVKPGKNGSYRDGTVRTCNHCNSPDHFAPDCPHIKIKRADAKKKEAALHQVRKPSAGSATTGLSQNDRKLLHSVLKMVESGSDSVTPTPPPAVASGAVPSTTGQPGPSAPPARACSLNSSGPLQLTAAQRARVTTLLNMMNPNKKKGKKGRRDAVDEE